MADKTQLELAIEERERHKTPVSVKILVALLIIGLGAAGIYTFDLKQELLKKEEEIILSHEKFQQEKIELLSRIKKLEAAHSPNKSN